MPESAPGHLTRRQLLQAAGAAAGLAAAGATGFELAGRRRALRRLHSFAVKPSRPVRAFRSRPDLRPPTVATQVATRAGLGGRDDPSSFLFLGPGPVSLSGSQQYGPLIVDGDGEPVWFRPLPSPLEVTNFSSARYRGEPVLIWWEGKVLTTGYGQGEAVILDRAYREVKRVRAANGRVMDMHALRLTPQGTALFTCYPRLVEVDLRPVGGPRRGQAFEAVIQEVDVATGRLLFEWTSLPHIALSESFHPVALPYDYLHVNSVSPTSDGNLLISGRHTWALYKLDRRTGEVTWRLGGGRSDFRLGRGARFAWQHDAQQVSGQTLSLFDNGSDGPIRTESQSRGLLLDVDEVRRTATVSREFTAHKPLSATAMGSVQILAGGHVMVGWGTAAHTSEFAPDGTLVLDASLPDGVYSYRSLCLPWRSAPHHRPAVRAHGQRQSPTKFIYVSWNGATQLTQWRVDAGSSARHLQPIGVAKYAGFETVIPLHSGFRYASVTALDATGHPLKRSRTIPL